MHALPRGHCPAPRPDRGDRSACRSRGHTARANELAEAIQLASLCGLGQAAPLALLRALETYPNEIDGSLVIASPGAIAFELGPLTVRWYGILMATSIGVGFWLAHRQAQKEGLPADDILRVAQWAVIAGLIGARLYEVAFNWDYYGRYPWKIPAVWEGGLAMHGGIIVGFLAGVALAIHWRVPVLPSLDVAAPSMILGQAIGRWGNFFNEEAFGRPTDLPWKLYISPPHRPPEYANAEYFHPTFLYESLWNLAVFLALVGWLRPRYRGQPGALFFWYIGLYSVGRFAIESLRLDSFWVAGFRVAQIASLAGIVVAIIGLAWTRRRAVGADDGGRGRCLLAAIAALPSGWESDLAIRRIPARGLGSGMLDRDRHRQEDAYASTALDLQRSGRRRAHTRPRHRGRARPPPTAIHRHALAPRHHRHRGPHRASRGDHHRHNAGRPLAARRPRRAGTPGPTWPSSP